MKSNDPKYVICKNAKKYCSEDISLIENYAEMMADNTQTWCCHHRREIDENKSRSSLIKEGRYFGVPACELIFLTASDHKSLHKKGVSLSDEAKQHISEAMKVAMNRPDTKKRLKDAMNRPDVKKRRRETMNRPDVKKRLIQKLSKQVDQYSLDDKFLKTWPSAKQAQKELGIFHSNICRCCKGKRPSAGNFIWKYHQDQTN